MKIAFIGQKGIPATLGGVERHVEELSVRMAGQGHEVFVYVRDNYTDKNLCEFKGVKLIHLPNIATKHLDAISHTFIATVHALFQPYDVIHYQAIGPTSLCWIIKLFKRKTVLVATFHCQDYFHQKWGRFARTCLKLGEWVSCKIPDKTITVSDTLAAYAKKRYGTEAVSIPNGARVNFNSGTDRLVQWNLRDKKYILTVGRLIKHKGVHYIVEAFKRLEDTGRIGNNFKLVIVGEGFHTDDYVKYLKFAGAGRSNIIFTGIRKNETLEQLYSHAYLFVQASESEGLSIALLEAMGYKLPVILSGIPENEEAAGGTGLVFRSRDIDDLVEKMAYLLNSQPEAEKMAEAAKARINTAYNWDRITARTLELYSDGLTRKNVLYERKKAHI